MRVRMLKGVSSRERDSEMPEESSEAWESEGTEGKNEENEEHKEVEANKDLTPCVKKKETRKILGLIDHLHHNDNT